jgi:adenosine/AMP kinase
LGLSSKQYFGQNLIEDALKPNTGKLIISDNTNEQDGFKSKGVEAETDIEERKQFLRKIGYKV